MIRVQLSVVVYGESDDQIDLFAEQIRALANMHSDIAMSMCEMDRELHREARA